jgi:hypothetical protein
LVRREKITMLLAMSTELEYNERMIYRMGRQGPEEDKS